MVVEEEADLYPEAWLEGQAIMVYRSYTVGNGRFSTSADIIANSIYNKKNTCITSRREAHIVAYGNSDSKKEIEEYSRTRLKHSHEEFPPQNKE